MSLVTVNLHIHADGCAGNETLSQLLKEIIRKVNAMPTAAELKTAVLEAVAEERAQVIAALEAALAKAQVPQADFDEIVAAVKGIYEPPTE